ncbi:hypothetical protein E4U53_001798 [Claviceps sorghi]|nr:hypothetical protein E4U53_001798 [Claviceps sorghi]
MPRKAKSALADGEAPPMVGLTDTETRFIKAVFDNMTQKPDADWDGVAADLSLKDAKCAKERFRQMSVRHGWRDQAGNGSPRKGGTSGTSGEGRVGKRAPRTPTKKVVKSAALVTEEDDESAKGEPELDDTIKGEEKEGDAGEEI